MASAKQLALPLEFPGDEPVAGKRENLHSVQPSPWMARVLSRDNLNRALKQVRRNKGAPGIDGMTVDALPDHLRQHWPEIRQQLFQQTYRPKPVRRVTIPKANGGSRPLGIPTVLDRFIQQAIAQVIQQDWDPRFHPHSYGFRPGRSAHQAVRYGQRCAREGRNWVVDLDLEAFFDRVNHDRLMARLKRHTPDRPLLRLINRYLKAGVQIDHRKAPTPEGVPQGGPLSPVLANVVLDELDWELERRNLRFARYADDCQIYVGSHRAGERVMVSLTRFIEDSLRLTVNTRKSAVDRPWKRSFLGFTLSRKGQRLKVASKAITKLKTQIRILSRRTRGHSLAQVIADLKETLLGWKAYFDEAEVLSPLRDLDKWIRRRMRCYVWKQWGRRGYRELRKRGVSVELAWNTAKSAHGPWRLSRSPALAQALPARVFRSYGLPELAVR
ncbi:group II intron reverse transcriptase/maturase [Marinobacter alexandrii]|uniref:group II intron reverse transcriptase/maturase n=1 Tax=Marinobacter alexandrii TaxID=2570351 RepID=UPI002000209F|nr:group II intron reverse transcriptase/maturase [Marinobacter alexandrii]MCK2148592.1 group II intron reverse transcriptase/maturase [Marinobacter alexandrii]